MLNRTEAIVISAAVALAMVPRFEGKVEQYVKTHRTEIQMAMNELQGKPAVPFAAPDADQQRQPAFQLASYQHENLDMQVPDVQGDDVQFDTDRIPAQVRAQVAAIRPQIEALK